MNNSRKCLQINLTIGILPIRNVAHNLWMILV